MKIWAVVAMAVLGCGMGWGQASGGTPAQAEVGSTPANQFAGGPGGGSTPLAGGSGSEAVVLKEILAEMRGIHNEVRLSETTQILLTELEVERGAVDKATEKRDNTRSRLTQIQTNEKQFAAQIAIDEENARTTLDPVQQKRITDQEQNLKTTMESFKGQEPDAASALQDAENVLRKEQETLDGIQAQLSEVVKQLQPAK